MGGLNTGRNNATSYRKQCLGTCIIKSVGSCYVKGGKARCRVQHNIPGKCLLMNHIRELHQNEGVHKKEKFLTSLESRLLPI